MTFSSTRTQRRRGAILSMEMVLVLPIFLLLVFSIVEFSLLMSAQSRLAEAARQGVRLLSMSGCPESHVREAVNSLLGPKLKGQCRMEIAPAGHAGEMAHVRLQVPMICACPDLLWMTGFSLHGRSLHADAHMVMERAPSAVADEGL